MALSVSAAGLAVSLVSASRFLSRTGAIATVIASMAGLFAFKLTKELNTRGVDRGTMKRVVSGSASLGARGLMTLGIAVAYCIASALSLMVTSPGP